MNIFLIFILTNLYILTRETKHINHKNNRTNDSKSSKRQEISICAELGCLPGYDPSKQISQQNYDKPCVCDLSLPSCKCSPLQAYTCNCVDDENKPQCGCIDDTEGKFDHIVTRFSKQNIVASRPIEPEPCECPPSYCICPEDSTPKCMCSPPNIPKTCICSSPPHSSSNLYPTAINNFQPPNLFPHLDTMPNINPIFGYNNQFPPFRRFGPIIKKQPENNYIFRIVKKRKKKKKPKFLRIPEKTVMIN